MKDWEDKIVHVAQAKEWERGIEKLIESEKEI
jgi:hypothetical protein